MNPPPTAADTPASLAETDSRDLVAILEILKALSARRDASEVLYTFTNQVADALGLDRCSVVRIIADKAEARVLASHEDAALRDLAIDLIKYPELVESVERCQSVAIYDTQKDPRTAPFAHEFLRSGITSIIVVPVILFEPRLGSLLLRAARKGGSFSPREVHFCELIAESAANALERAYLLEDLRRANADLQRMARTDGLTGLYNRTYFRQRLDEEISRAVRYKQPLACIFLDVDDFKAINDTHGHLAGDGVLQEIARRISKGARHNDIVARYGGEELVILLPHTDRAGAIQRAKRLLASVSESPYPSLPPPGRVTVSIGLAMFDPDGPSTAQALIGAADKAVYKAKELGKNRLVAGDDVHAG